MMVEIPYVLAEQVSRLMQSVVSGQLDRTYSTYRDDN
jgi:hypothetical protein